MQPEINDTAKLSDVLELLARIEQRLAQFNEAPDRDTDFVDIREVNPNVTTTGIG